MKKVLLSAFAFLLFTLGAAAQSKVYSAPVIAASMHAMSLCRISTTFSQAQTKW